MQMLAIDAPGTCCIIIAFYLGKRLLVVGFFFIRFRYGIAVPRSSLSLAPPACRWAVSAASALLKRKQSAFKIINHKIPLLQCLSKLADFPQEFFICISAFI